MGNLGIGYREKKIKQSLKIFIRVVEIINLQLNPYQINPFTIIEISNIKSINMVIK
jgi:hypothetical protein